MLLNVADLIVEIYPKYNMLKTRSVPYIYNGDKKPELFNMLKAQKKNLTHFMVWQRMYGKQLQLVSHIMKKKG